MSKHRTLYTLLALLAACGGDSTGPASGPPPVASVSVSPATASIFVGTTRQFSAVLRDASANTLSGRTITWQTSNATVASVSSSGMVTALATGSATITATSEGKAGSASVTINLVPVATVTVTPSSSLLGLGSTAQLSATTKDSAGNVLAGRVVTWSSSNTTVASVSTSGLVTAGTAGSALITATSEGKSGNASISVDTIHVATVTVAPTAASVGVAATMQLTATTRDSSGTTLIGRAVSWTSSAPAVATVSPTGLVTGVALGSATVTATSEGKTGTATITVVPGAPASVTVFPSSVTLSPARTAQLHAAVLDAAGDTLPAQAVTWASLAAGVATVDPGGLVTGVSAGTALITATSSGYTDTASVTVTAIAVDSVAVSPASVSMHVGQTSQLSATTFDSAGNILTGRGLTWSSSDPSIAAVSLTGLVTGKGLGVASIVATSEGRSDSATVTITLAPVATVVVSPASASIGAGVAVQLSAITLDSSGDTLSGRVVTWSSSAANVASVDSAGLVSGNAAGTATITATSEGQNGTATIDVVVNLAFPALDGGYSHTCSLTPAGKAYCWGLNDEGELGSGVISPSSAVPLLVSGGYGFASLYPGGRHTCALDSAGAAYCWGSNTSGQLGFGSGIPNSPVPGQVVGGLSFVALTGGFSHSCGLISGGIAFCWGSNGSGELGDGTTSSRTSPVPVSGNRGYKVLSARGGHSCGITFGGLAYCWGRNSDGELGDGTKTNRTVPVAVLGGHVFTSITTGAAHTCALKAGGSVYCWGENVYGQLGDSTNVSQTTPVAVKGGLSFVQIKARGRHTCGLTSGGQAYCWGQNLSGELGDGSTTDRNAPVAVLGGLTFTDVSSGANFSCGVTTSPLLYCWGSNVSGQLGDGTFNNSTVPVKVRGQP